MNKLKLIVLASLLSLSAVFLYWTVAATSRTWNGASINNPNPALQNNLWSNNLNWSTNIAPIAGDDLNFPASLQAQSNNNFASGTTFNSISISGGHFIIGNPITLSAGVTAQGGQIGLGSITLGATQDWNAPVAGTGANILSAINTNAKRLSFSGTGTYAITGLISGTGQIQNDGALVVLTNNNTYTGSTVVNAGTLLVNGSQPQSDVTVKAGGTIGGSGTVGNLTVQSASLSLLAAKVDPGNTNDGTGILKVDDLTVSSTGALPAVLEFDLKGTTVGTNYDQIDVANQVLLSTAGSLPTLQVDLGFTPAGGSTFTIINNRGPSFISNTFSSLQDGQRFQVDGIPFFITYTGGDGNDVVLHVPETKQWSGAGANNLWSTGANWVGGVAPQEGDSLVFPDLAARLSNTNDFPNGTIFHEIQITGSGYSLSGNSITLMNGISDQTAANSNSSINFSSIRLGANQTFNKVNTFFTNINSTIDTNGQVLTVTGAAQKSFNAPITNNGIVIMSGTGDVQYTGGGSPHTYSGPTFIQSGSFTVFQDVINSDINLTGGMIRGNHSIKSLTGTGGTIQLDNTSITGLATANNVVFSSNANVVVELANGTGTPISRGLTVGGSVGLGNATLTPHGTFNGAPPPGTSLIVINKTSAGPVTGTFNNLPEGSLLTIGGTVFHLTYFGGDGNDVFLNVPATRTWDGGGATNNWTESANWVGDVAPAAGDILVFPAGALRLSNVNDFTAGTSFSSITLSGPGYALGGNAISLNNGITENVLSGSNNSISVPITLNASQSFVSTGPVGRVLSFSSVNTNGKLLTLDGSGPINCTGGTISGTGGVTRTGTGLSVLNVANSYTGATTINGGTLRVQGTQPSSPVFLDGGQLTGGGTIGPLISTGGTLSPVGGGGVPTLTVAGNTVLSPSTTVVAAIQFTGLSDLLGQLNVNGTVNLNGSTLSAQIAAVPSTATSILINNDGSDPIVGTFAGLPEGAIISSGSRSFRLSYVGGDGNDVTLTIVSGTLTFTSSNYSVNESNGAATITLSRTGGGNTTAVAKVTLADGTTTPADYRFLPGTLETAFNSGTGPNDRVDVIANQPNDKFLIGGDFTSYNGVSRGHIARINADGSLDNSFDPGSGTNANSFVQTISQQVDTKIIIGGGFNSFNGTSRNNIARLFPDGSLDLSYNVGSGASDTVYSTAIQRDGRVVIGGNFTSYNGTGRNRVARLNVDGSLDTSFNPGSGANDFVLWVAIQPADHKILIGGFFTSYNGIPRNRVARLNADGSLDLTFNPGSGPNNSVFPMVVQPDGKILIGGSFTTVSGLSRNRIARLNSDGTVDLTFGPGTGPNDQINSISLQPDGKIIAAGNFTSVGAGGHPLIVRLTSNGSLDNTFDAGPFVGPNNGFPIFVGSTVLQPDGKVLFGGNFTSINGTTRNFIARVEGDLFATWEPNDFANKTIALPIVDDALVESAETLNLTLVPFSNSIAGTPKNATLTILDNDGGPTPTPTPTPSPTATPTPTPTPGASTVQFSTSNFAVAEDAGSVTLTVFRTGDTSSAVSVDFRTTDTDNFTVGCSDAVNNQGGAFGRCDFATAVGTVQFAAGETQKQIVLSIINDAIVESAETFQVVLENPIGAVLGTLSLATVTIPANDTPGQPNPIFQSPFFVRLHYLDFLSREPDSGGFNAWVGVLNGCPDVNNLDPNSPSANCDRILVSQSFFGSPEFQIKGFYVFRFYKLAFNRLPEYLEIVSDMSFVAGATPQEVFQRKAQLAVRFTQRPEFITNFGTLSNSAYVNALLGRYQLTQVTTPDPQQPDDGTVKVTLTAADLTSRLNGATLTRAQVLRAIADSDQVGAAEFNNAFVAMQYYGYLRRKPDPNGFNAWLLVLQTGDIRTMINGFMNSAEYRLRFGAP